MTAARPRVLVVDDSAFARKVVREVLTANGDFEVVAIARDGLEALERFQELRPDAITLDLVMPNLDGVGVLNALPPEARRCVILVSMSDGESELGVTALQAGAFDLVHKPTALATGRLYELGDELRAKMRACLSARAASARAAAAETAQAPRPAPAPAPVAVAPASERSPVDVVVIGTSTGGPQALTRLLTALPASFPVPLAVALHIPAGYTESLARRLDERSAIRIHEAAAGQPLVAGQAMIAPGGQHLVLAAAPGGGAVARIVSEPLDTAHHPSVDILFASAVDAFGGRVLGVVLTGMGQDGLEGARRIRQAGGRVLVEDAASCVVHGMPRAVSEAGLATEVRPLEEMAAAIVRLVAPP